MSERRAGSYWGIRPLRLPEKGSVTPRMESDISYFRKEPSMSNKRNTKQAKRAKVKKFRTIFGLCCVVVLVVACVLIGINIYETHDRLKEDKGLQELYQGGALTATPTPASEGAPVNPQGTNAPAASSEADAQTSAAPDASAEASQQPEITPEPTAVAPAFDADGNPVAHADFEMLMEFNEHLVGWLDATSSISLPIVHHDNEFYLNHDFYGDWDDAGTVFVNEVNTVWPADRHLLLHGHNMRDGTAFGPLEEMYSTLEILKANPIVYFRLINENAPTAYVPFAIFEASVNAGDHAYFDVGNIFFNSDEDFVSYAQSAMDRSLFTLPIDVQPEDHLISLVTCSYGHNNGRFIVMCRALRDGETEESIAQLMQTAVKK